MPFVEVHMIHGRTEMNRDKIAKAFTETLVEILGVQPSTVWIQFGDMSKTRLPQAAFSEAKSNRSATSFSFC